MTRARLRATYVEIPATDLDRAESFYLLVFGATARRTVIDGHQACLLDESDDERGSALALMSGHSYVPSVDGTRVYLTVDDIERVATDALRCGGEVLYPVTTLVDGPTVAEIRDSEGNRIGLSDT